MNLQLAVPVLVIIVGLLMWRYAAPPKVAETGKIMFACGFLVTLMAVSGHVLHISG